MMCGGAMGGGARRDSWSVRSPHYPRVIRALGRYEVLGRLAVGGTAEILLARDQEDPSREVVLKRLLPSLLSDAELVQMFLDEARIGMRLSHPNICAFYDVGQVQDQHVIAMEYVRGVTLEQLIRRAHVDGGLPPAVAVWIIAHVAGALHYVHRARDERGRSLGIVHRDVSPKNVMVSFAGDVKLVDFGLARSRLNTAITAPGMAKGKFSYMAPEQYQGLPFDARADVFALGVCLYELLTAQRLYRFDSPLDAMNAVVHGPVPSIRRRDPGHSESLDDLLRVALAKTPAERYDSAGDFQAVLEAWLVSTGLLVDRDDLAEHIEELFEPEMKAGAQLRPTSFSTAPPPRAESSFPEPLIPKPPRVPALESPRLPAPPSATALPGDAARPARAPTDRRRAAFLYAMLAALLIVVAAVGAWLM